MDWKQYVSLAALLVSIGSCTLSYDLSRRVAITSVRPVLTFQFDVNKGWSVRNVGNGPALDVLVAMKSDDSSDWAHPMRIPPLSKDGEFGLQEWEVYINARTLGATYSDIQQRTYTTTCTDDLSRIHEGNAMRTWSDLEIKRHWH
jgi:hypothetical protein